MTDESTGCNCPCPQDCRLHEIVRPQRTPLHCQDDRPDGRPDDCTRTFNRHYCKYLRTFRLVFVFVLLVDLLPEVSTAPDRQWRHLQFSDQNQAQFVSSLSEYHIITPTHIDAGGEHISYNVVHDDVIATHSRVRRDTQNTSRTPDIHFSLPLHGDNSPTQLHLAPSNHQYLSPGLVIERRQGLGLGNIRVGRVQDHQRCHYRGSVAGDVTSNVALSNCNGLTGFIRFSRGHYFIEPVRGYNRSSGEEHPHLIYSSSALPTGLQDRWPGQPTGWESPRGQGVTCGLQDHEYEAQFRDREAWEDSRRAHNLGQSVRTRRRYGRSTPNTRRRSRRSVSIERYLSTLVVVDPSMMKFYEDEHIEVYIMTLMNMVSTLFHDSSIGNLINLKLVRIMLVEKEEQNLNITYNAGQTLHNFCSWQNHVNPRKGHPNHHDVAVLITRQNICHSTSSAPCSTLGLSIVASLCLPHQSCNINEDTGLMVAYTIAHELGHNFGMQHDSVQNGCVNENGTDPEGSYSLMLSQMTYGPLSWSKCSRNKVTDFLDRGWGDCLNDEPTDHAVNFTDRMPGIMYNADHQCALMYGHGTTHCHGIDSVCNRLWCQVGNHCMTGAEAAADGTICDDAKWCIEGECVAIDEKPRAVDGEWSAWTEWSACSRTCGAGVEGSERHCENPAPSHGGRYCLGKRRRHRVCNTEPCAEGTFSSFRQHQCEQFNLIPYNGTLYRWNAVYANARPCTLYCRPVGANYTIEQGVLDGTECQHGTPNMCIDGRCRHIGCDFVIDSMAHEDRCGVCHGDGTKCTTVEKNFHDEADMTGYVEATVIPKGARNIYVAEVSRAPDNFLAIRDNTGRFVLNGDFTIQWSGDYEVAGTTLHYERRDDLYDRNETEYFQAAGPLKEPLQLWLLCRSTNPGVTLKYTLQNENVTSWRTPEFRWEYLDWTHCTPSCGGGHQRSEVICTEKESGRVEDRFCDHNLKPEDLQRECNMHICPARWWTGPWQRCSRTCHSDGPTGSGVHHRTVLCVRNHGFNEQIALEDHHCTEEKPLTVEPCRHKQPCPPTEAHWEMEDWSETCTGDPCDQQIRKVYCSDYNAICSQRDKPTTLRQCGDIACGIWTYGEWSECSVTCGMGMKYRDIQCTGGAVCHLNSKPDEIEACGLLECVEDVHEGQNKDQGDNQDEDDGAEVSDTLGNAEMHMDKDEETADAVDVVSIVEDDVKTPSLNDIRLDDDHDVDETIHELNTESANNEPSWDLDHVPEDLSIIDKEHETISKTTEGGILQDNLIVHGTETIKKTDDSEDAQEHPENITATTETVNNWNIGNWSECSSTCGVAYKHRNVSCTAQDHTGCTGSNRPDSIRRCVLPGCTEWRSGTWSKCTRACGGGQKMRLVQCVNPHTRQLATMCDVTSKPPEVTHCNTEPCSHAQSAQESVRCMQNESNFKLCKSLKRLGQCSKPFIREKCCHACKQQQHSGSNPKATVS